MFPNLTLDGSAAVWAAVVVGLVLAVVWVIQFVELMALADDAFPGQFVRLGWVAAFVTLWFFAPFAFLLWNQRRYRAARRRRAEAGGAD